MGCISSFRKKDWIAQVAGSNAIAMKKSHKYPLAEKPYIVDCLEWHPIPEHGQCGCDCESGRIAQDTGVWVLKSDLEFDVFLCHFAQLWVRGSKEFVNRVNGMASTPSHGGRWKNLVPLMRCVERHWNNWDGKGNSLPGIVNQHRCTLFCSGSYRLVNKIHSKLEKMCQDSTGVYTSKLLSQLFPDIVVPFDSASKIEIKRCGYDPYMWGEDMKDDICEFLCNEGLTIRDFRGLDDAPSMYWKSTPPVGDATTISRVIDKLFYK